MTTERGPLPETRDKLVFSPHEMEAQTLNCPNCGATILTDASQCKYCESKVATTACPSCFAMMFLGSSHCSRCGAAAAEGSAAELSVLKCPRCKIDMLPITLGAIAMRECQRCVGLWVEIAAFEKICADREQQAAVLGAATPAPAPHSSSGSDAEKIRYVPCPECSQLMNRINFARCSGVIVDVCKGHGTWFDQNELSGIVQFIRGGGLEVSRQKERRDLEFERQQLRARQLASANSSTAYGMSYADDERMVGLSAASELLELLLK